MARHSVTHPLLKLRPEVLHKNKELPNSAYHHLGTLKKVGTVVRTHTMGHCKEVQCKLEHTKAMTVRGKEVLL